MTVTELMAILAAHPGDMPVLLKSSDRNKDFETPDLRERLVMHEDGQWLSAHKSDPDKRSALVLFPA